jgi:hypothetical protein
MWSLAIPPTQLMTVVTGVLLRPLPVEEMVNGHGSIPYVADLGLRGRLESGFQAQLVR